MRAGEHGLGSIVVFAGMLEARGERVSGWSRRAHLYGRRDESESRSGRVRLRKGSPGFTISKGGAKKEKEGGNKHPFIEFLLWSRSSLSRISFTSLNSPVLAKGSEA